MVFINVGCAPLTGIPVRDAAEAWRHGQLAGHGLVAVRPHSAVSRGVVLQPGSRWSAGRLRERWRCWPHWWLRGLRHKPVVHVQGLRCVVPSSAVLCSRLRCVATVSPSLIALALRCAGGHEGPFGLPSRGAGGLCACTSAPVRCVASAHSPVVAVTLPSCRCSSVLHTCCS
jgi:hypothetical protein